MDILKRDAAPITQKAWNEIDDTARDVLLSLLTARRSVHMEGPKGMNYNAVPEGRVKVLTKNKSGVGVAKYNVFPLLELRNDFSLQKWELDNIERGCKDIDLSNLEKAVEEIALLEEDIIYNGYKDEIKGLSSVAGHTVKLSGNSAGEILKAIGEAKYKLTHSYVKAPFNLIVSQKLYEQLLVVENGVRLLDMVQKLIEGKVFYTSMVKDGLMFPQKHEDLELTIGQDFAIGYQSEDQNTVNMYVTESLYFRVLDPDIIVSLKMNTK